ncbi:MAG TPA: HAD-IA family hydrolase [Ktedonobacteraceae bacterium]|jgi:HAD superfamily hydrolase (TIGR01509 family)|nr:HAD-IA family hydrolase [Ktedonobacteraceae bacterium]
MHTDEKLAEPQSAAPPGIRAILCDVGGVLIHKTRTAALQQWEKTLCLEPMSLPLSIWLCVAGQRAMLGQASVKDVWDEIQQRYGLADAEREAFRRDFEASDSLDADVAHFLRQTRPACKVALLSNAWPDARQVFSGFGLDEVADLMILSCEEELVKLDRRIYDLAAERLHLPHASIVFIDDYPPHVAAAQVCGMQGIVYETREQTLSELQRLLYGR